MLERRGRFAARHFAENRQGALGRTTAEAWLRPASPDPERVPRDHGAGPPPQRPRSGTTASGGLTAPAPAASRVAGAESLRDILASRPARRRVAGTGLRRPREMTELQEQAQAVANRHIIERPRLTRLLDETTARVILLVAPAGYGKTVLARQWLGSRRHVWFRATSAAADVA